MVGKGRHPILGVRSPDPVLSLVSPIALGMSLGTALVVDLAMTLRVPGRTLADLVTDGPSISELSPARRGVAFLPGGEVARDDAVRLLTDLATHWPAVVIRLGGDDYPFATVPVTPLFPGRFSPVPVPARSVWQPVAGGSEPPGPGPVLPGLRAGVVRRLLAGQEPRRSRWIEAWRPVWEMPWA